MKFTNFFFATVLVLGNLLPCVCQAQTSMLKRSSQFVNLTGSASATRSSTISGYKFTTPLSSLKRIDPNGTLTDFIIPDGRALILMNVSFRTQLTTSTLGAGYTPPYSTSFDWNMLNFYPNSVSGSLISSGSKATYQANGSGTFSPGLVISRNAWNSLTITFDFSDASPGFETATSTIKVSGYIATKFPGID
jgi:hypothetical protein